jgi:uroporphyrinogen-III synthase
MYYQEIYGESRFWGAGLSRSLLSSPHDDVAVAVLSHETKDKVDGYGVEVDIMPDKATAELLIKDIIKHL